MEPLLVTLAGDYKTSYDTGFEFLSRRPSRYRRIRSPELMGNEIWDGIQDFGKSVFRSSMAPFISPIKGIAHAGKEIGRGVSSGSPLQIFTAIPKGIAHAGKDFGRSYTEHAEFYYRPSKARTWMKPAGIAMSAIGTATANPFILAGGAALTAGGTAAEGMYQKDQQKKAKDANDKQAEQDAITAQERNKKYIMVAGAVTAGLVAYTYLS